MGGVVEELVEDTVEDEADVGVLDSAWIVK